MVCNGWILKNKFGNIDVYVLSMVFRGGVYIIGEYVVKVVFLVGVDYVLVLIGFDFKGCYGMVVLNGVVVVKEVEEVVRVVIEVMGDLE